MYRRVYLPYTGCFLKHGLWRFFLDYYFFCVRGKSCLLCVDGDKMMELEPDKLCVSQTGGK